MKRHEEQQEVPAKETSKAQLRSDVSTTATTTGSDHACAQRLKQLFSDGQATSASQTQSATTKCRVLDNFACLVRGAKLAIGRYTDVKHVNWSPTKPTMNTRPSQSSRLSGSGSHNRDEELMRSCMHNNGSSKTMSRQSSPSATSSPRNNWDTYSTLSKSFTMSTSREESRLKDGYSWKSVHTSHAVHLEGVTEGILVIWTRANRHEVDGKDHPLKLANTDVVKDMQALEIALELRTMPTFFILKESTTSVNKSYAYARSTPVQQGTKKDRDRKMSSSSKRIKALEGKIQRLQRIQLWIRAKGHRSTTSIYGEEGISSQEDQRQPTDLQGI
ncbi:hypothetical protein B9Z55_015207 [Caenorhabditis nigoni]|uniref:Uncharacterized protein n=1 Tax=Caenorhabditis nigoni TaxID=1611254 RepID=A0A2G5U986_9PELO|nr:hypothetical protein B9Z55_015207 [Caenorhabditis nigoni]